MSFALERAPDDQAYEAHGFSLARGALHEFYATTEADSVSLSALALMLGEASGKRAKLWVRHETLVSETGAQHPAGLKELGVDYTRLLLVRARDASSALQAGLEGARCTALAAVIIELRGDARAYDLTASRRLALAAKTSGVSVFLLRIGATGMASAAETRWLACAAPSRALDARAPGHTAFHLTLLRARNQQNGGQHRLEWNRDARCFENHFSGDDIPRSGAWAGNEQPSPLSRLVVPVSFDRSRTARDEPYHAQRA